MKKQWLAAVAVMNILALGLVGCKNEEAEVMTEVQEEVQEEDLKALEEKQNKIIAEYAAGVLMKYNAESRSRVLEGQKLLVETAKEDAAKAQEQRRQELLDEYNKQEQKSKQEESISSSGELGDDAEATEEPQIQYITDMSSSLAVPSFSIVYTGYETADSYAGDMAAFSVDAGQGKVLIITKFQITNTAGQEEELNVFAAAPEFRLKVSDKTIKAHQTMLLNDLSMYKEVIPAGESKEAVLIFEVAQDIVSASPNMELIIKMNEQQGRMLLEGASQDAGTAAFVEEIEAVEAGEQQEVQSEVGEDDSVLTTEEDMTVESVE